MRNGTTWLVYGPSGIGKTPFASCFPKPWWWDCEGGTSSVLFPNVPITQVHDWGDVSALSQLLQNAKEDRVIKFSDGTTVQSDTIVVDTLGEMARIVVGSIKGVKESATLPDWSLMVERIRKTTRILRDARDKGWNIVFICHEQYLKAGDVEILAGGYPDLPGKELPIDLPKLCDVVGHMKARPSASGNERILVFEHDGVFVARDRSGKLARIEVVPPFTTPDKIKDLIKKAGVTYA